MHLYAQVCQIYISCSVLSSELIHSNSTAYSTFLKWMSPTLHNRHLNFWFFFPKIFPQSELILNPPFQWHRQKSYNYTPFNFSFVHKLILFSYSKAWSLIRYDWRNGQIESLGWVVYSTKGSIAKEITTHFFLPIPLLCLRKNILWSTCSFSLCLLPTSPQLIQIMLSRVL